jgi:hypothetical protein
VIDDPEHIKCRLVSARGGFDETLEWIRDIELGIAYDARVARSCSIRRFRANISSAGHNLIGADFRRGVPWLRLVLGGATRPS